MSPKNKNKKKIKLTLWSNPKAIKFFNSIIFSVCASLLIFIGIPFLEKETSASSVVTNPNFIFRNWDNELSNDYKEAIQRKMKLDFQIYDVNKLTLPQALAQIHSNLDSIGVCKQIHQIRKIDKENISVTANMHLPWAIVERENSTAYITKDKILLPNLNINPFQKNKNYHLIKIKSPAFSPPLYGQEWLGADISHATNLINTFYGQVWGTQISFISFEEFKNEKNLVFYTTRNKKFIWGSTPGTEKIGERITSSKLHYLNELYKQYNNRIDGSNHSIINLTLPTGAMAEIEL